MYAFGSRVRGDHMEGSDFDVLVIVHQRTVAIEEAIMEVFVEEEIRSGISFDPVIKTAHSFELEKQLHTPFFENIQKEGIQV
jgi:predicted nucleotidyltransferase